MNSDLSYNIKFPDYVRRILSRLAAEGFDGYAVGGCVRDSILGRIPHDWDVTTEAVPDEVMRIFAEGDIHVIGTAGVRHGTVMVKAVEDVCEITTFRCDGDYNDHRRPDSVTFSKTVEDDLARRDFTMNAIAAKPDGDGVVIKDPFGGEADIAAGIIRTVGDPVARFSEDALRIMRA
ncbi:MAG: polynucleotide adenylyltransferase, partial [Clostridia bacterium]|nr:polynucleotide adenylyltransferase [Clostridia bacterium]